MPKFTLAIGVKETESTFETRIVNAAKLLVGKYNVLEHNAYTKLRRGQLNRVFELAGMLCQPHLEPIPIKRKLLLHPWLRLRLRRKPIRNGGAQRCHSIRGIRLLRRSWL
jgi:hypothetical protein